jgi:hypothetical protein
MAFFSQTELIAKFKELLSGLDLLELKKQIQESGQNPPEHLVQIAFRNLIKSDRSRKVILPLAIRLKEITGVLPESQVLKELLLITRSFDIMDIFRLYFRSFELRPEFLQEKDIRRTILDVYEKYLASSRFLDIQELRQLTGIEPPEENLQRTYRQYQEEGKIISFVGLFKRSGVRPQEKLLEEILALYKKRAESGSDQDRELWGEKLKRLEDFIAGNLAAGKEEPERPAS